MTIFRLQRKYSVALNGTVGTIGQLAITPAPSGDLTWSGNPFPMSIAAGSFVNLAPYISDPGGTLSSITSNIDLTPFGLTISMTPTPRIIASAGASAQTINNINLTLVPVGSGGADWASRIAGSGVVWYHNFDSNAEVNQFRWSAGIGADLNASGNGANLISRVATGGPPGSGGYLQAQRPVGTSNADNSIWYRPFNPLTGATNGRGVNDPAAGGSIALEAFSASQGSNILNQWDTTASNPGWYMHPSHQAANAGKFQGSDFWLQIRVRRPQTPGAPPDSGSHSNITGKFVWLTSHTETYVAQELVTYGQSAGLGDQVGVQSQHSIYTGQNYDNLSNNPNATLTIINQNVNWRYSGGWDTLLYHVTPGTNAGTGTNRQRVEVWAQHDPALFPAEAGVYVKIWDVTYSQSFSTGTTGVGATRRPGYSALICGIYHNGSVFNTSTFNFQYAQMIFSKNTIPAPIL